MFSTLSGVSPSEQGAVMLGLRQIGWIAEESFVQPVDRDQRVLAQVGWPRVVESIGETMLNDNRSRQLVAALSKLVLDHARLLAEEAELWRDLAEILSEVAANKPEPQARPVVEVPVKEAHEFLSAPSAARLLNISVSTLAKWRMTGDGPKYAKIGNRILYRRGDLTAFVDERSFPHTSAYDLPPRRTRERNPK